MRTQRSRARWYAVFSAAAVSSARHSITKGRPRMVPALRLMSSLLYDNYQADRYEIEGHHRGAMLVDHLLTIGRSDASIHLMILLVGDRARALVAHIVCIMRQVLVGWSSLGYDLRQRPVQASAARCRHGSKPEANR